MDLQLTFEALAAALAAFLDSLAADSVPFVDPYMKVLDLSSDRSIRGITYISDSG